MEKTEIKAQVKDVKDMTHEQIIGNMEIAKTKARYFIAFHVDQRCFDRIEEKISSIQASIYNFICNSLVGDEKSMEFNKKNIVEELNEILSAHDQLAKRVNAKKGNKH